MSQLPDDPETLRMIRDDLVTTFDHFSPIVNALLWLRANPADRHTNSQRQTYLAKVAALNDLAARVAPRPGMAERFVGPPPADPGGPAKVTDALIDALDRWVDRIEATIGAIDEKLLGPPPGSPIFVASASVIATAMGKVARTRFVEEQEKLGLLTLLDRVGQKYKIRFTPKFMELDIYEGAVEYIKSH